MTLGWSFGKARLARLLIIVELLTVQSKVETILLAHMSRRLVPTTTVTILLRFAEAVTSELTNSTLTPSWFTLNLANSITL